MALGIIDAWIQLCVGGVTGERLNRMGPFGKYWVEFLKRNSLYP